MRVGDEDGHGHYGVLNEDANGLLCHERSRRLTHPGTLGGMEERR